MPGTTPPTNSRPIETLPMKPYRISPMLGGIVAVISEPTEITALA